MSMTQTWTMTRWHKCIVGSVLMYDNALNELITAPYGTAIIRVDHDRFEIDAPEKEILIEKGQLTSGLP